jgi:hypothetical protein
LFLQLAVNLNTADFDRFELTKRNVTPFCVLLITVQNGIAEKQIIAIVFSDKPITSADEEMQIDDFVFKWDRFCFVQTGDTGKTFIIWFVPHIGTSYT